MRKISALDQRLHHVFQSGSYNPLSPASKKKHQESKDGNEMGGTSLNNRRALVVVERVLDGAAEVSCHDHNKNGKETRRKKKRHSAVHEKGVTVDTESRKDVDHSTNNNEDSPGNSPAIRVGQNYAGEGVTGKSSNGNITDKVVRDAYEAHLMGQSLIQNTLNRAIVVRDVARKKLFRHAKFLTDELLVLDGEICNFVLTELGRAQDKSKYRYSLWMTIKPILKQAINTKRTSVSMIIKEKFISKYIPEFYPSGGGLPLFIVNFFLMKFAHKTNRT